MSDSSRRSVLARMNYAEMVQLFDLLPDCACPADPRRVAEPDPAAPGGA